MYSEHLAPLKSEPYQIFSGRLSMDSEHLVLKHYANTILPPTIAATATL